MCLLRTSIYCIFAGGAAPDAKQLTKKLGKQGVNSLFTDLRKIAQHPLLMRRIFDDDRVLQMAKIAHPRCALSTHICQGFCLAVG